MQHGGMSRRGSLYATCCRTLLRTIRIFTYLTSFFKPFSSAAVSSLKHGR